MSTATPKLKFSSLKADLQRESDGDWVECLGLDGASVKVRSLHAPAYRIARDLLVQKMTRKYQGKPIPPDVQAKEFGRLYALHILLGWKGFYEEDGTETKYTPELAMESLTSPEFRKLFDAVEWAAAQVAETDVAFVEDAAKTSAPPSAGS